ncbi:hypothetical protein [Siphonobacter sp. SORGH_AS_0500]|uniref:hypothetical protein n=1 Tax=Siphonobacter sp. SORGH_AS_0500 TaxID=1864824 RepID=UPI00285F88B4|nr:hypothetical protein [Siphonobacter sp. SORGH_AS_0500]MDR6197448.1 hypothetical protein [Siphonobacter sp. SORGH_AS_0500]
MKRNYINLSILAIAISISFASCVTSRIKPYSQVTHSSKVETSSVTVFLLERDIPQNIERLGVVSLRINGNAGMDNDKYVKDQLFKDCKKLGANGAYRINDGTYTPLVVSYLVFKY